MTIKTCVVTFGLLMIILMMMIATCGPAQYTLNTQVSPEGAGAIAPASGKYDAGTVVTLVAEPAPGYAFDYWSDGSRSTTRSVTITMDSDKSITAHFKKQYTLTVSVSPSNAGAISPTGGIYDAGTTVVLYANPASGFVFDHWGGDATGTSTTANIIMNGNKEIIAHFKIPISLSPVCKGIGVPEATAYQGSKHPVVLLGSDGKRHNWTDDLPIEWRPTTEEEIQLVACVGGEKEKALETCSYYATPPYDKVTRYQYILDIKLREAKTGKIVASTTLRGSEPRACSQKEYYHVTKLEGSHISISEVQEWLHKYVGEVSSPQMPTAPSVTQEPTSITSVIPPSIQPAVVATSFESTTYNNDKYGFSIQYPSDWVARPDLVGESTYMLAGFTVPHFIPGVIVAAFPADEPVTKAWVVKANTLLKNSATKVVSDIKVVTLGNGTTIAYTYKIQYITSTGYEAVAYCLDADKGSNRIHVWVFTIDVFMPYDEKLFSEIVNTLRFNK